MYFYGKFIQYLLPNTLYSLLTTMNSKLLSRIAYFLLLLLGIVLCLKSVREPDLWWMYRTGEWMLENGQVTYKDPFSYTHEGVNWINVKWLFEIIITLFKSIGGPEMVFVLQAIVTTTILVLLSKTTKLLAGPFPGVDADRLRTATVLVSILALFAIDYRMIGRPEMSSHLMTAAFIYLFILYHRQPDSKWIYALIPLQLLWTNLHEAFGIGMVLMMAFLVANWAEYYFRRTLRDELNVKKPLTLTWATLGALFAVVVNPRGPEMWLHPFNIFGQLEENKMTTELASYQDASYWLKEAYINIFFLLMVLLMVIVSGLLVKSNQSQTATTANSKSKKTVQKQPQKAKEVQPLALLERYGLGYLLLGAMLFYLSLTAYRNIPFFIIVATPVVALGLERLLAGLQNKVKAMALAIPAVSGLLITFFYVSVISGSYHKWTASRDEFGLQVLNGHNPIAAAQFLKDNEVKGRCFSDFLVSAYLLWKLEPEFKTYIDLRDLDIFPKAFFDRSMQLLQDPKAFDEEDKKYNFDYAVLLRRNMEQVPMLYRHLQESAGYEAVFADAVAVVYLKKNAANQAVIDKYALDSAGTKDIYHPLAVCTSSPLPAVLNKLFNPLFKNKDYTDIDEPAIAAHLYYVLNKSDRAMRYAKKAAEEGLNKWRGHELQGLLHARDFLESRSPESAKAAMTAFDQAISLKSDAIESLFGKAVLLMEQDRFAEALPLLQSAKGIDPKNPAIQQHLSVCFQKLNK